MSVYLGRKEFTESGKLKIGNTDIAKVYVGDKQIWPRVPAEIDIILIAGATDFSFECNEDFTVTQDGTTTKYIYTGVAQTVTGVHSTSGIIIKILQTSSLTYFKFKDDKILSANLFSIGNVTSLEDSFRGLTKMEHFSCDADLSTIVNFIYSWESCSSLTDFPIIDTSNGTEFHACWQNCNSLLSFPKLDFSKSVKLSYSWRNCIELTNFPPIDCSQSNTMHLTWAGCAKLKCISGTLDFRKSTDFIGTFQNCTALIAPAPTGTPVRLNDSGLAGLWTNTGNCNPPAILTGHMFPTETGFSFESDGEFEVTQSGTTTKYTGTGVRSVTGVDGVSEIEIKLINTTDTSYFKFKTDSWNSVNLKKLGNITTLSECFPALHKMINFECDADTSKVTNMYGAWSKCYAMINFPLIDTSTCTIFHRTWYDCKALTSFPNLDFSKGTVFNEAWLGSTYIKCFPKMDFSSLTFGESAFWGCSVLIAPPVFGTPVRSRDTATRGIWTNPNPCP